MKRYFLIGLATLMIGLASAQTRAEVLPNAIAQACPNIKVRLRQAYLNDDLSRVNYGQTYESVLKNIMVPTNARLVANRYDASRLIQLTTNLETKLNDFRSQYQVYKTERIGLINQDCQTQPENFYSKLQSVRQVRAELKTTSIQMRQQVTEYQAVFKELVNE